MKSIALVILFGLMSSLSPAKAAFINFENESIVSHGERQDKIGSLNADSTMLMLTGNVWKSIFGPYTVTSNTYLNFDFASSVEGEIHGIGFSRDNNIDGYRNFVLAGSQDFGRNDFDTYNAGDGWVTFEINVGSFYRGNYDYLFFINDNDLEGTPISNSSFRDVEICELGECSLRVNNNGRSTVINEPSTFALLAALPILLFARRSKKHRLTN